MNIPERKSPTQLYNNLLVHIMTKSDLRPDSLGSAQQKPYLTVNKMRMVLLNAIQAVDPSGTFAVNSLKDDSGYYLSLNLVLGGKSMPLEFKSYFVGWNDVKHLMHDKNMSFIMNTIERQICCSQQYALRRLFSSVLGINEGSDNENIEIEKTT